MDILKDIEKSLLAINMYDKSAEPAKLSKIKKLVGDYFKHKGDESNVVSQKIAKYDEQFKKVRERNEYEYDLFLEKKDELRSIFKETKTLSSLYDYLNYKYTNDHQSIPDIYTYEYFDLNDRIVVPKASKAKEPKKDDKETKVPKVPKAPKAPAVPKAKAAKATKELKDCPEGKVRNPITKRCVNEKKAAKANADEVKEVIVKVVKEPKAAKATKELKDCPEGKVRNPITNRCIKDVNYKKNK
uniref:Uncharacterized protein n=1 Tax=viral metagenome TaxID=1070528 RepID=A0A6C0LMT0_9ZZZZ